MRIFAATSRYIQGPGVLAQLGQHTRALGRQPVLIVDQVVQNLLGAALAASFADADLALQTLIFPGEVTPALVLDLAQRAPDADVVIGMGGGKAIDAAKGVARALGVRMISVPTVASNDGPASASIALYNDAHQLVEVQQMARNPDLVLVDTAVIAAAPLRFFLAGIGDAISKKFEAEACLKAGAMTLFGAPVSHTGMMAAEACYQLIRQHALAAVSALKAGRLDAEVEAVIEATVLLSTISFENGGLSVAHAVARGLPCLPRAAGTLHGAHVAYGLLVQLVLEQRPRAMLDELIHFYRQLGLPWRLADLLGAAPEPSELELLAQESMLSPSAARFTPPVTRASLLDAIHTLEAGAA